MRLRGDTEGVFKLQSGEAHVWHTPLRVEAELTTVEGYLSPDEQQRASRLRFQDDRDDFVVARGLLRLMIGRYLSRAPESVEFVYGAHGKPSLAGDTVLEFNVAHSHRFGLFAFTLATPIGIDVEYVRPIDHSALAARFFSPSERAALERVAPDRRHEAFFRCWTRKEAYIKALGTGLSDELSGFDVSLSDDSGQAIVVTPEQPHAAGPWVLYDIDVREQFRAAVAVRGGVTCITVREVSFERTLNRD